MKKILFINPSGKVDVLSSVPAFRMPPLNLLYLQHLTDNNRYDVCMCDENVNDLQYYLNKSYDLVAITCLTSNSPRAYEIADIFRKGGTPTIIGGIHVSMLPDEASHYADSVVIGEAERIWSTVLNDFENNELKKRYTGGLVQPSDIPVLKSRDRGGITLFPISFRRLGGAPWTVNSAV